jgi:S-layer homology domain
MTARRRTLAAALWTCALLVAATAAAAPAGAPLDSPKTFGIEGQSVYAATAFDFQATVPTILLGSDGYGYRSMLPPADAVFLFAPVRVPEGAVISFLRLHACDSAGGHLEASLVDLSGDHQAQTLGSVTTTAQAGCGNFVALVSPPYLNVQNKGHHLMISLVQAGPNDGSVAFDRVEVFYTLSVSPPPATADFSDVPVTHPYFQFVEALVQSGITAGCGGGRYCPDAPLTRGQMAVFLSKALGLHWPNAIPFP